MYQPSEKILENYAEVLIKFALNSGVGAKHGDVIFIGVPDIAKPLAKSLQKVTLEIGAIPMMHLYPTGFDKDFFDLAQEHQLKFFPADYLKERVKLIDHVINIIADPNPEELKEVDPAKIMLARNSKKEYRDWLNEKENKGEFTWTLALWGTEAKAKEVGLSYEDYWQQIINACFLDSQDPIEEWKKVATLQQDVMKKLNGMDIVSIKMQGPDVDISFSIGKDKMWKGGSGRNIPSFEIFTSPNWRGTNGWIRFNQSLYRYGQILKDVFLRFKDGVVVEHDASQGRKLLTEMLQTENADKVGEYSLTDKRFSRINHVMAETLFDENIGGPYGNTHIALGMAYKDCFKGDPSKLTSEEWVELGFNDSAEHTDIISTTERKVTAILDDGSEKVIYDNGQFTV